MDGNNNFDQQPVNDYSESYSTADYNQSQGGTIMGKLSFIFGIVGMVLSVSICCSGFAFPFGVASLVLGIIGKKKDETDGKAKLGFIFGIITLAIGVAGSVLSVVLNVGNSLTQYLGNI